MKRYIYNTLWCTLVAFTAFSCTDMDEYKKISGNKEILYTGKIEDVTVYPGDGRVKIEGICQSDPKIVDCRIYWDLRKDSVDVAVDMSGGPFLVEKEITGLEDKVYNFEIRTLDADGNSSIPVYVSGRAYGARYRNLISNRLIRSAALSGTTATIEWRNLDRTQGPVETEVVYTDTSGKEITVYVPVEDETTTLADYKPQTAVKYTTIYKPVENSLDTFRTGTDEVTID